MFSQCPDCQAIFQVSEAHLKAADGNVRCGQCLTIFNAEEFRRDDLLDNDVYSERDSSKDSTTPAENPEHVTTPPAEAEPVEREERMEDSLEYSVYIEEFDHATEDQASSETASMAIETLDDTETERDSQASSEEASTSNVEQGSVASRARQRKGASDDDNHGIPTAILEQLQAEKAARLRPSRTPWVIGTLFLMLTLLAQGTYFLRNELAAQQPSLRPWLEHACALANCQIDKPFDIKHVEIINRDVRSDPDSPDALIASTTIINNATFNQPYPLLTLTFSDITGTRMAQRRFTPEEYLSPDKDIADGMSPNLPILIELKLMDPGKEAVNFEFIAEADPRQHLHNG